MGRSVEPGGARPPGCVSWAAGRAAGAAGSPERASARRGRSEPVPRRVRPGVRCPRRRERCPSGGSARQSWCYRAPENVTAASSSCRLVAWQQGPAAGAPGLPGSFPTLLSLIAVAALESNGVWGWYLQAQKWFNVLLCLGSCRGGNSESLNAQLASRAENGEGCGFIC